MRTEDMAAGASGNGEIAALRAMLDEAERVVVLTGAGISTDSGIPDFRSPGGLWTRMKPITYQEFVASEAARLEDWRRRFKMNENFARAEPNAGHLGLVHLAQSGRLAGLITQNIDGLHQRSGLQSDLIVEIHGNATHGRCLDCRAPMELREVKRRIDETGASPHCACGGPVKAAIISFGESMPEEAMDRAIRLARSSDLFLAIGSSLQVQPAASLPLLAKKSGARLAIINRDRTTLDADSELLVRAPIGVVFRSLYPQLIK